MGISESVHRKSRSKFGLPGAPPKTGISCGQCVNGCMIPEGESGYCGMRWNQGGEVISLSNQEAVVSAYNDPLPTNCVADWVCPGGSEAGFPEFSHSQGPEMGYVNLAVFYGACTYDCLFCQNWHFREMGHSLQPRMSPEVLTRMIGPRTSCICFFGGDPTPFIQHTIAAAELSRREGETIRRICWETNGSMSTKWARMIGEIALDTGGCVKVDFKTFNDPLNMALCGSSNRQTLRNLELLSSLSSKRKEIPLLVVSTLMVPGYVNRDEVAEIARFVSGLDPQTPYSLLAFHPAYLMSDLPATSLREAKACEEAAREAGLENVRIGNEWLLR